MTEISAIYLSAFQLVDVRVERSDGSVWECQCLAADLGVLGSALKLPAGQQYPSLGSVPLFVKPEAQLSGCHLCLEGTLSQVKAVRRLESSLRSDQEKDVPSSLGLKLLAWRTRLLLRCSLLFRRLLGL